MNTEGSRASPQADRRLRAHHHLRQWKGVCRASGHRLCQRRTDPCYSKISLRFSSNSALSISPLAKRSFKISKAREAVSYTSGSSSRRALRRPQQHISPPSGPPVKIQWTAWATRQAKSLAHGSKRGPGPYFTASEGGPAAGSIDPRARPPSIRIICRARSRPHDATRMRHGDMSTSPPNGPYERDAAAVKNLHELGKIGKRSRQPVHLIHDDHVDLVCLISVISLFKAGRSIVPPENPPSSYSVRNIVQPLCF